MDREDIGKMMDLLYQIMVKELMQAGQLRKPPEVERKPATPTGLPAHLYLVGRLRGYNKDEVTHELGDIKSAVEETKSAPSLKNTRVKVRSGRSQRDTPFQLVDRALNRLLPFFAATIDTVRGDKATVSNCENF